MKYKYLLISLLLLVGCQNSMSESSLSFNSSFSSESTSSEITPLPNLVISKLITATASRNNVIELFNPSSITIDLTLVRIDFYGNGSLEVTASLDLTGTIESNDYYVIGGSNSLESGLADLFDFTYQSGSLPFNGNDYFALMYENRPIDVIGYYGFDFDYSKNVTFIRMGEKESYQAATEFDPFNFIRYIPDYFQSIGHDQHLIKTSEQLYAGPQLESRYLSMPYVQAGSTTTGGGGAVVTTNSSVADGDTAFFTAANGFGGGSVRYYYINTPEVDGAYTSAEPWGYTASKYHKEFIMANKSSSTIHVQSIPGGSLKESNGRNLGLIWVNGQLTQFLIVREGLSEDVSLSFSTQDLLLTDRDVPYLTFLQYAEFRAKQNGWGTKGYPNKIDGEKSPDWNYQANGGVGALATTTPVWFPHIPLPW
jgi:hypothetical protein